MENLRINGKLPEGVDIHRLVEDLTLEKPGLHPEKSFHSSLSLLMDGKVYEIRYSNPDPAITVTSTECPELFFDGQNWVVR